MTSRPVTLHAVPPVKLNTAFIGATLMTVGGVLIQIANGIDNGILGVTGVIAALIGLLTMIAGSLLSRDPSHQAPDKPATLLALALGAVLVVIAVLLLLTAPLTGIAFIVLAIAATLINLSDYITRPTTHTQKDHR